MESGMKVARKKIAKKTAKTKKPAKKAARKKAAANKPRSQRAAPAKSPSSNGEPITWNFKLIGHHLLDGFGGMGEGMSIQIAPDGRRILWLAHESAPKNFTAVDVSDPRKPKVVVQTDLPQAHMRSNSLETCGNIMAVAYQAQQNGLEPPRHGAVRHLGSGEAEVDLVFRLLGRDLARGAPVVVLRRRIRALRVGGARLHADPSHRRPVL